MFYKFFRRDQTRMGIVIGQTHAWVMIATYDGKNYHAEINKTIPVKIPLFNGPPTSSSRAELDRVIKEACDITASSYLPVQVAIPDPIVELKSFELDEISYSNKVRVNLAKWLFSQEHHFEYEKITCVCQRLNRDNGKNLLLSLAIETSWLESIHESFQSVKIYNLLISKSICFKFNHFREVLVSNGGHGVLISLDPESWSLLIWDGAGNPCFSRSRWWGQQYIDSVEEAIHKVTIDIERTLRAYISSDSAKNIKNIYVSGPESQMLLLISLLDERLEHSSQPIPIDTGYTLKSSTESLNIVGPVFSAAVRQ